MSEAEKNRTAQYPSQVCYCILIKTITKQIKQFYYECPWYMALKILQLFGKFGASETLNLFIIEYYLLYGK